MVQALGASRYIPQSPSNLLKQIVEDHLEDLKFSYDERFAKTYGPLSPRVIDLFERFTRCADPHFGFIRLRCPECGEEKMLPFSCKVRGLCSSCEALRGVRWAERMVEEVLPEVTYVPLVITIPKMIRPSLLFDRKLYGDLCRTAYRVIREHLERKFSHLPKPTPAMLACPQSFGNLANFHPHCHLLVSAGVFDEKGNFHEDLGLDFRELELPFRDALLEVLEKRGKTDEARIELLKSWTTHSGFQIYAHRMIGPLQRSELESILRYMLRPPVSLKRLTYLDTGMVLYQGHFHPGLGRDHQLVTGLEFLAMLVPHITLRYECRIHLYGAISTTFRKRWGWIGKTPSIAPKEEEENPWPRARRKHWAHFIRKVWMLDPELCSKCGSRMKMIAAISSPEQDDIIEAILKARKEWNPPWQRRARPLKPSDHKTEPYIDYEIPPDQMWTDED